MVRNERPDQARGMVSSFNSCMHARAEPCMVFTVPAASCDGSLIVYLPTKYTSDWESLGWHTDLDVDCDCSGCDCHPYDDNDNACPTTCYGYDCTYWVEEDGDSCIALENKYGCDCAGCSICHSDDGRNGLDSSLCGSVDDDDTGLVAGPGCLIIIMIDQESDGWDGAEWKVETLWRDQTFDSGTLVGGGRGTEEVCGLSTTECLLFVVSAGGYGQEVRQQPWFVAHAHFPCSSLLPSATQIPPPRSHL
jgi:hypothetical protein